jgi:hypothetical protein
MLDSPSKSIYCGYSVSNPRAVNSAVEFLPYKQAATSSNLVPPMPNAKPLSLRIEGFLVFGADLLFGSGVYFSQWRLDRFLLPCVTIVLAASMEPQKFIDYKKFGSIYP